MKYRHRVLGLLSLLLVITYLDRVCLAIAGPRMQEALHIGPIAWGWVTGMFTLSYAAFEIPSGALGDRLGPRRVLTRIVVWWSVFTSLTGLVSNYNLLLLIRFCFGMGEAGAYPNAGVVISRWFPPLKRTSAWGIGMMSSQLGGALAPWLVVPLQMRYGWRVSLLPVRNSRSGVGSGLVPMVSRFSCRNAFDQPRGSGGDRHSLSLAPAASLDCCFAEQQLVECDDHGGQLWLHTVLFPVVVANLSG